MRKREDIQTPHRITVSIYDGVAGSHGETAGLKQTFMKAVPGNTTSWTHPPE